MVATITPHVPSNPTLADRICMAQGTFPSLYDDESSPRLPRSYFRFDTFPLPTDKQIKIGSKKREDHSLFLSLSLSQCSCHNALLDFNLKRFLTRERFRYTKV